MGIIDGIDVGFLEGDTVGTFVGESVGYVLGDGAGFDGVDQLHPEHLRLLVSMSWFILGHHTHPEALSFIPVTP